MFRKITFLLLCVFVLNMTGHASAELVGYWKFDEGAGTTVLDSSPYGNDGDLEGTPEWVTGPVGLA